jgi:hypothetical protein
MSEEEYNKEVRLEKIPLAKFVAVLSGLLSRGVEYIDIIGIHDEQEDFVGISVIKEYLSQELQDKFNEIIGEDGIFPMDDDDDEDEETNLNDLI